ncbi:GNAT family N-acetyltransferase [Streptomyces sp. NPDC001668]|uniref:GNAT family N-acetyltransferase n=1 Tax=Streptomyces sp. NPDC001668 TaxID=3364598 RepID=UPI0036BA17EB
MPPPQIQQTTPLAVTRAAHYTDLPAVNALHARCSLASTYARYRCARRSLTRREWTRLVHPAAGRTWVTSPTGQPETVIAVTHLLRTSMPGVCELALLVEDAWQGQGLGTRLAAEALAAAEADASCRRVELLAGAGCDQLLRQLRTDDTATLEIALMEN